jgi:hypothetical protein
MKPNVMLILLSLSAPAGAQTISCLKSGIMTNCNVRQAQPLPDYTIHTESPVDAMERGMEAGRAERQFRDNQQAANRESAQQAERDLRRKIVGGLVAAGQCNDAVSTALRDGDFELAAQTKSICAH